MKIIRVLAIAMCLIVFSCKKETTEIRQTELNGRWKLIYSYSYRGIKYVDADDPVHSVEYTFDSVYNFYFDDSIRFSCNYLIQKSEYGTKFSDSLEIKYDGCQATQLFHIKNMDTLVLSYPGVSDLGPLVYERI
jgi:hypothetical protein